MNSSKTVDYIIVGQGLAGSCLALQLIQRKKTVMMFDQPADNRASAVAAGLFNPITGRVMAKTWLADTLFPYIKTFYTHAEIFLGKKFLSVEPLYRPFVSVQEQNGWMGKSADPLFADYIAEIFLQATVKNVNDPFGGLVLNQSGYLDVVGFLQAVRSHLSMESSYLEESFDETRLEITDRHVRYGDLTCGKVIFCNGISCRQSPYFSWLPINPLKGETLQVRMDDPGFILNRGVYVVRSRDKGEFTVGATYDFTSSSPGTTPAGRIELESKLMELVRAPYHVTHQSWGIRPTSLDQKLMMGPHPRWGNLVIFNGLGTKGVSLAPYFSDQLSSWLTGDGEIMPEVNIERYKSLYSKLE